MSALKKPFHFSEADYLAFDAKTDIKHEYVGGYIHAMAGASERHNLITGNIFLRLRLSAGGKNNHCRVFSSDMKFREENGQFYYFPDVMLVCNQEDDNQFYKEKPCFIAEVSSKSTQVTDRREKLTIYSNVPSLNYYLIVDSTQKRVEYFRRDAKGQWLSGFLEDDEILDVRCEDYRAMLDLNSIYEDVVFNAEAL